MALVHIEMSEYKAMEEKAALLDEVRKTERELHEEIRAINQEKAEENKKLQEENAKLLKQANDETIRALEDAKMKVVKIVEHHSKEHVFLNRRDDSYVIREFMYAMGVDPNRVRSMDPSMDYGSGKMRGFSPSRIDIDRLINAFFTKEVINSKPNIQTTVHGLDEIKVELREQLNAELDEGIRERLSEAREIKEKNSELLESKKSLEEELISTRNSNEALTIRLESAHKDSASLEKELEALRKIRLVEIKEAEEARVKASEELEEALVKYGKIVNLVAVADWSDKIGFYKKIKQLLESK